MTHLFPDFRDLLLAFHDAEVEFMVVGGTAVAHHGHARATKDLDVFIRPSESNAERVIRALRSFGAPVSQMAITVDDFSQPGTVVQMGVPPIRIDLITQIDGLTFEEAKRGIESFVVDGVDIPVIGLEALLANKRASGRNQDLADVEALESLER